MRPTHVVLFASGMLGAANLHAAERNPLESRLIVDAGWFFMSTDMRVRVDGDTSDEIGSDVDFDDTFGIGDFDRFRGEVLWRIGGSRHALRGMYFQNNREATRSLERDVEFGEESFPVGATVRATSDATVIQLSYEYAFLRRESYELAGGIGVHYLELGLGLDGTISGQGGTASRSAAEEAATEAPLPVLGLRGLWRLSETFYVTGQVQYFYLEFDPYKGSLVDLKATIVWQPTDHFGVGLGYNDFGFRFDIEDKRDFDGTLRWDYGGAMAFATFSF